MQKKNHVILIITTLQNIYVNNNITEITCNTQHYIITENKRNSQHYVITKIYAINVIASCRKYM